MKLIEVIRLGLIYPVKREKRVGLQRMINYGEMTSKCMWEIVEYKV